MGERLQKTISMYRAANKSKDSMSRAVDDRAKTGLNPYVQQSHGSGDKMNHTMSSGF